MYYVSMTDTLLSQLLPNGIKDKFVVICETKEQANNVVDYYEKKTTHEMRYINISKNRPRYSTKHYKTTFKKYEDCKLYH